ncbi:MAG: NfeD family protein, partial [Lachnospiraceae bacterium]|nr:NfeD family protein [Lachnospiraceae bacterium]
MAHIFWLIVAAVMIVLEIVSLGLTTIWFAGGALVTALVAWAFEAHWIVQVLVFAIISLVLLIFTRPIAKKHLMKSIEKTNVEGLIGTVGCVTATINNIKAEGTVKLDGKEWWAKSVDD